MKNNKFLLTIALALLLSLNLASAVIVSSVSQEKLYPGESAKLSLKIKNTLNEDIEDVSLALNLDNTSFTTIGSSEDSEEEINEDKEESFSFEIKASANLAPGDYNIPYTIEYTDSNETEKQKTGKFGISVSAKTELSYGLEFQNNILGTKGKVSIKAVNSGLGDIGFVNVKIISSNGIEFLGTNEEYIGTINSDDFEIANFEVLFKSTSASLTALIIYKDFENKQQQETITLPIKVYTLEKAKELGLIKSSKTGFYVSVIIIVLIIWFVYKKWKKSKKLKERKAQQER